MSKEEYIPRIVISIIIIFLVIFLGILYTKSSDAINKMTLDNKNYMNELFDKNKIVDINIEIEEQAFNKLKETALEEEYSKADIIINGQKYKNIGIRPKGNSTLTSIVNNPNTDRFSFKIKTDEYEENQNICGLSKFVLNNNIGDATNMKEYLSYDMLNSMGIVTPGYAYANVKVNGKPWGFYLAVEAIDEDFLERNYKSLEGNLYKVESQNMQNPREYNSYEEMLKNFSGKAYGGNLVYTDDYISSYADNFDYTILNRTSNVDKHRLINILKNLSEKKELENCIDVDEVLRYFAVNSFLVNLDSTVGPIKHNFYLYEEEGKLQIIPWDYNVSFGAFILNDAKLVVNYPIDTPVMDSMENNPLISKLLEIGGYKERYYKYLKEICDNYINNNRLKDNVNKLDKLISENIKEDPTAFYSYDEYKNSLSELISLCDDRSTSILKQISGEEPSNSFGNVSTKVNLLSLGTQNKAEFTKLIRDEDINIINMDEIYETQKQIDAKENEGNYIDNNWESNIGESEKIQYNLYTLIISVIILIVFIMFTKKIGRKKICC